MDAILGALGLGDIGRHFPDTDKEYEGISSLLLADRVCETMKSYGARIENIDCTVIAQKPKLSPYISLMRENIAKAFDCDVTLVNVKATTEEGLGFSGAEEGISAHAVCLISFES
jgi:2-C-methyl-D-erythritol 2,4-cyclodiphosphate synthase